MTVIETLQHTESLSLFAKHLKDADLLDTLEGDGPFTLFVPNNEAFNGPDKDTLESMMMVPEVWKEALLHHLVTDVSLTAADLATDKEIVTASGYTMAHDVVDGAVVLQDEARIITSDIAASNGVIHVIDTVMSTPVCCKAK